MKRLFLRAFAIAIIMGIGATHSAFAARTRLGSSGGTGTLECVVSEQKRLYHEGDVPGIASSTAPSLWDEICNQKIPSCGGSCIGDLM